MMLGKSRLRCSNKDSRKHVLPPPNFQVRDLDIEGQEVAIVQYLHDC
jgi:hypothetical protein